MSDEARDPLDSFPDFAVAVRARLEQGQRAYGDRSFERPVGELIGEIREELLDVAGWAFIALQRLEAAQRGEPAPAIEPEPPAGRRPLSAATQAVVRRKRAELEARAGEPAEPFVTSYFGIALTAAQRAEVERLAGEHGCITRTLVWRVRDARPTR